MARASQSLAPITIAASASDSDGTVKSVAFYANGAPIGSAAKQSIRARLGRRGCGHVSDHGCRYGQHWSNVHIERGDGRDPPAEPAGGEPHEPGQWRGLRAARFDHDHRHCQRQRRDGECRGFLCERDRDRHGDQQSIQARVGGRRCRNVSGHGHRD